MVVNVESKINLFGRWFVVVVTIVRGLALLIKNNTGDFTIVVVTTEANGD